MQRKYIWPFLLIILSGIFCALAYLNTQQNLRQSANDPQTQMAEDTARAIQNGASASQYNSSQNVDIASSLAPYLIIYDKDFKPIAGTGYLNGRLAQVPSGVLAASEEKGENKVTWQPKPDIRQAIVAVPIQNGGYAVAGRSLREIEKRESQAGFSSLGALFAAIAVIAVGTLLKSKQEHDEIR